MGTKQQTNPKIDALMQQMTDEVIRSIEGGLANPMGWQAPWHAVTAGATNAVTKRRYNGGNWLWLTLLGHGPWATYKQWESVGAQVRKGEHGTVILVPVPVKFEKERADGKKEEVRFTRYRTATVFHGGQVDGWEAPEVPAPTGERNADADALIEAWSKIVPISHGPNSAYYVPILDTISVPEFDHFKSADGYYATVLHEIAHSTGHGSRLNRSAGHAFGSPEYAKEELVAELTAAFLGQHFGIATGLADHNRDYLANWLQALRNDPQYLWDAATQASKAVAMLLAALPDAE